MISEFETDQKERFEVNEFQKIAREVKTSGPLTVIGQWEVYTSLICHAGQRAVINWANAPQFVSKGHVSWTR